MKKLILIVIAAALVLAAVAAIGIRLLLNPERLRAAVEAQASAALGMPVSIGAVDLDIWPRAGLTVEQVAVGQPAEVTLARARLSTGLRPLLSRRVEDAEVVVEDSRLDVVKLLAALDRLHGAAAPGGGPAAEPAAASGESGPALTVVNVRTIGLRNVELVAGSRQATVSLESTFAGDRLDITRLTATTPGTSLVATGAVESVARRVVRLKIDADPLDLDGLMQFASVFSQAPDTPASTAPGGAPAAMDLRADVHANGGKVAGLEFSDLDTTIAVTPSHVALTPLRLKALDGGFAGTLTGNLAASPPELAIDGSIEGVNLQKLAAFASGAPSGITGTFAAKFAVRGRGLDPDSALKTASGSADVSLRDGRVPGLQLVRPAVLAFGRPQEQAPPEGNGEDFERITATLAIANGQMRTDNLAFVSRDVDVDGRGTLTMTGGALAVDANLKLSEELSAQAGRDLVRYAHEGNRVVLPATVSGSVESPRVMIDAQQALRRALTNELQDRATSALDRLLGKKKPKD